MKKDTTSLLKFKRLLRKLKTKCPYCDKKHPVSKPLLVGLLELLWTAGVMQKNPKIAREDVEIIVEWQGEEGAFTQALIDHYWLDFIDENTVEIHSFWEHCPNYVKGNWKNKYGTEPWKPGDNNDTATPTNSPPTKSTSLSTPTKSPSKSHTKEPTNSGGTVPVQSSTVQHSTAQSSTAQSSTEQPKKTRARNSGDAREGGGAPLGDSKLAPGLQNALNSLKQTSDLPFDELADRCINAGVEEHAKHWLTKCFTIISLTECNLEEIQDAIKKVEDSNIPGNPKGEGPFKAPEKFIVKQIITLARKRKAKIPAFQKTKPKSQSLEDVL